MGTHMPHGITQCYLPPGRGDIPALTPAEAGTRLSDPGGMQGWVDLVGLLHTEMVYRPKTVTHPGTNRARRALTSFMRRTPLTAMPRHQVCDLRSPPQLASEIQPALGTSVDSIISFDNRSSGWVFSQTVKWQLVIQSNVCCTSNQINREWSMPKIITNNTANVFF